LVARAHGGGSDFGSAKRETFGHPALADLAQGRPDRSVTKRRPPFLTWIRGPTVTMTELSSVDSSVAGDAGPVPAAGGPKQDPVVPDSVVYVCSVIIVVMVVGGVIGLSILMKQRLDVNQNVTSAAPPGPAAPPPIAKLVSVEDSESNDFKVFNDDDPFRAETTTRHGKRKVNVAQNKHELTKFVTTAAARIREVGAVENISNVGKAGVEIRARKNGAKAARNDTVDSGIDKGDIQASETAISDFNATEHKALIKVMKPTESGKPSELDQAGSHNQTAPAVVSGSSTNGMTSNTSSLSDARAGNLSIHKPAVSTLGNASLTDASSSRSNLAVGGSHSEETSLRFDESASYKFGAKKALPAADSAAVNKSSPGAKSPVDVREENPPAKPPVANGSPAQDATGAAAKPSVAQGSQSKNEAQTIAASGARDKPSKALKPANEPSASAPSGVEKKSAAADSAEKALTVNTSVAAGAVLSGASSDIGSPAKKEAAAAPGEAASHGLSSSPGSGDGPLPNQAVEEKHAQKSKDTNEHGAGSLAAGPSAQRPLFCEARKAILRPLASYCTHILFGRLPFVATNGVTTVGDFDSATQEQLHLASVVRPGWPHVSLMTTLGGGGERDDIALAKAFESGATVLDELATQAANLVRKRGLDGLNVHWSVPDLEGDVEAYAAGLVAFVKKLRKELGPSFIITVVLPSESEERNSAFNVRELQPLVNFLFVSTHDTFSPYSTLTHFNGPAQDIDTGGMFTAIADVMKQLNANQSRQLCFTFGLSGVAYKVDADAPLAKYVPLVASADTRSAQGAPNSGQQAKEGRVITYDQVCKLNLTCHKAHVEKSCYDKVGDTWYGYVDEEAVAAKAKWILKDGWENLCVVAWNVDADDVKGSCRGDVAASYPLLRSLSQATAALAY
ncbi:hypothetical protein MRX96_032676, partial [Rhipicephalus microplus]